MTTVGVFVPAYGGRVVAPLLSSILQDYTYCMANEIEFRFFWHDVQPVHRSRNLALDRARSLGFDYLLSYDSDTFADPRGSVLGELLGALHDWNSVNETKAVAIGAVVIGRGGEAVNVRPAIPDSVYPAEKMGTGIMLIDVPALDRLKPEHTWFDYRLAHNGVDVVAGEDVFFTQEVTGLGGVVLANYQIPTRHLGSVPLLLERFHLEDMESHVRPREP